MSVVINFDANSSRVVDAVQAVQGKMEELNATSSKWTQAMGVDAMLNNLSRVVSVLGEVGRKVGSLMSAAADKENVATQLGVMFGSAAEGNVLADALERMATNGVVGMQELQSAAGALIGTFNDADEIARWVGVFADISAGSKISATRLAELTARLDDMGKAELTELANAGIPIFETLARVMGMTTAEVVKLSTEGKITKENLLAAFEMMTAEGEKFHQLNASMSNTTAGSWDTLAASWREVLAEAGKALNDVVRPLLQVLSTGLQECKGVFAFLVRSASIFVMTMAAFKVGALVRGLYSCVTALGVMKTTAGGVLGIFKSIGRVGWMLVITGAVQALMALYDKFFGSGGDEEAAQRERDREEREKEEAARKAEEERMKAEAEAEAAKLAQEELEARRKQTLETLRATESLEAFNEALKKAKADELEGIDVAAEREAARVREEQAKAKATWEELQRRERSKDDAEEERRSREKVAAFKELSAEDQRAYLAGEFAKYGVTGDLSTAEGMRSGVTAMRKRAAEGGLMYQWNMLEHLLKYVDAFAESETKRADEVEKTSKSRGAKLEEIRVARKRQELQLAGDKEGLAAFDDEQERKRLSAEYQAAGLSKREADMYAAQYVQRKRALDEQNSEKKGVQVLGTSMTSVGGGGYAVRMGDAQLTVAKRQLDTLGSVHATVEKILGKMVPAGIAVVS